MTDNPVLHQLAGADPPLQALESGANGRFRRGQDGVKAIFALTGGQAEFICFATHTLCYVRSSLGHPALYPIEPSHIERPVRALLMDLDGTSVHSESFWIWAIEKTTARLLENPAFFLEPADLPYVAGRSVSEHLQHCLDKYCPGQTLSQARAAYFELVHAEMEAILQGKVRPGLFDPAPGLKDFIQAVRKQGIKLGLVTAGLYEKGWPEIVAAFQSMDMGDPRETYDAIITAGFPLRDRQPGTLGELEAKPHPWLYAEAACIGLGIPHADRHSVVGIEDSAAGILSIRLAGFSAIGLSEGNIEQSGARVLCDHYCESLSDALSVVLGPKMGLTDG